MLRPDYFELNFRMGSSTNDNSTPWKNGYYHALSYPTMLYLVNGENFIMYGASGKPSNLENPAVKGTWKFGEFGEAHPDVAKESGKSHYNVAISAWGGTWRPYAVLSDDGKKLTHYGMSHSVDVFEWISEEEVAELKECGDPVDAPSHHYKEQPENQGKLLWISGAPGLGKSTSGLLLGRKAGYVYYEADAFINHLNPFIPIDVDEPTLATFKQRCLKGVPQHRIDAVANAFLHFLAMIGGKEYDDEVLKTFYSLMAADIDVNQKRIGGNWAVAQAVPTRAFRDHIRSQLGPNLIFVVLHMDKEDQIERLRARHGDDETFVELLSTTYNLYEPATDDEPNSIHVLLTNDMTRDDVADKILQMVKNY